MKLTYNYTRLLVGNFRKSYEFYRDVLGFKPRFKAVEGPYEEFKTGKVTLAIFSRDEMSKAIKQQIEKPEAGCLSSVVLIFAVKNVDKTCQKLHDRGLEPVAAPKDRKEWAIRTAHFRDPDGNLIEINSPLPNKK
jgi:lactoylglutathione lyase